MDTDIKFFRLPPTVDRKSVAQFMELLCHRVLRGRTFACLITTDAELQRLNRTFRKKDYPTDVLSFPTAPCTTDFSLSSVPTLPGCEAAFTNYLGDLAISWQRARAQANDFGHSTETELQVLMLHGALHLAGMDHETDHGRMSRSETRWRRTLGLPAGLIERVSA